MKKGGKVRPNRVSLHLLIVFI